MIRRNDTDGPTRANELITVLKRLEKLHAELAELIDEKIEKMRACDTTGMNECSAREQDLAGRIGEQESLRRALTDRIGRAFGMSPAKARQLTALQLAEKLAPARHEELSLVAGRLGELMKRIARRNQIAGRLSQTIVRHLDVVLTSVASGGPQTGAYSQGGGTANAAPRRLFETVG